MECLQQWQRSVLLSQSTHPKYQTKIDEVCNVCNTPFKYKGKSRREQLVEFTGAEIVERIKPGNLIITSRHSSEKNMEAAARNPQIADAIAHWTEAVFMIVEGGGRKHVMAVNLTRPFDIQTADWRQQALLWKSRNNDVSSSTAVASIQHFIGGPMRLEGPAFAMLELEASPDHGQAISNGRGSSDSGSNQQGQHNKCPGCGRSRPSTLPSATSQTLQCCDRACQLKVWFKGLTTPAKAPPAQSSLALTAEEIEEGDFSSKVSILSQQQQQQQQPEQQAGTEMAAKARKKVLDQLSKQFASCRVKQFPNAGDLFFGEVKDVLLLAEKRWEALQEQSHLRIFWGFASWGATQLVAELARRSWGLSEQWDERGGLAGGNVGWADVVDHMSIAKASEYSRDEE